MRTQVTKLCPACGPDCCPEVFVDDANPAEKQVEITDDFGGKVNMSREQFQVLVQQAKEGKLAV